MFGVKSKSVFWGLVGIIGFHLAANIMWLWWDKTPPAWDQAAHLRISVLWANWLGGSGESIVNIIRQAYGYPPLITLLGGAWGAMVGIGVDQISFLNSLFFIGLVGGVFVLAKEVLFSEKKALTAAVIITLVPVVYDISRNMLLDLPLTIWFIWGTYWWIKSDYLRNLKGAIFWGIFLVLASLTKLNGFIYFGPMVLISGWRAFKKDQVEVWLNLTIVGVIYLLAVSWWWAVNKQNIISYLTGLAGAGEKLTDPMNLSDWQTWIHYLRLMFLHQLSPIGAMLMFYGLLKVPKEKWQRWSVLIFLVLVNYIIFTIIKNKDFRFTLPFLPLLAIGWAEGLWKIKRLGWVVTFGYLGWMYVNNSFGFPVRKPLVVSTPTFLAGDVEWVGIDDYPVRSPKRGDWPQKQIIKDISYRAVEEERRVRLLVLINIEELNDNNLFLEREMSSRESLVDFGSVGMQEKFNSREEWEAYAAKFGYVLVARVGDTITPFYSVNAQSYRQATEWMWELKDRWQKVSEYELPNGSRAYLIDNPLSSRHF